MCLLKGDREGATRAEAGMVAGLLEAQFGSVSEGESVTTLMLDCGGDCTLRVDLTDRSVEVEVSTCAPGREKAEILLVSILASSALRCFMESD